MTDKNYKYERDELQDISVMESIITGYILRNYNKIQVGTFNKIATTLGLDKRSKESIVALLEHIHSDPALKEWHSLAIEGQVGVEDLEQYTSFDEDEPVKPIEEKGIQQTVAPYILANEEVLANNREFREVQRTGAHVERLFSGLKSYLADEFTKNDIANPQYIRPKGTDTFAEKELVLGLSDWHVGALVTNPDTGGYDFNKLTNRVSELAVEAVNTAHAQGINHIHAYFIGDLIEHINMRNVNQAFEAEFPATEQIAKGIRLIYDVLVYLSSEVQQVTFGIVGGNHDRFQGNKNDKVFNDNVAYLTLDMLFFFKDLGTLPSNITLIDNREDVYSFVDEVAGKTIKVVHGDMEAKREDVKIRKHIRRDDIDYLIMGHIHTTRIIQEDYSRFHIYVGSPMGANNYSSENNLPTTSPSQFILVLDKLKDRPMFSPIIL